jgi:hypothetical protein
MIGRRSLITAALGALGAGASGVKAGDLVKVAAGIGLQGPDPHSNVPMPVADFGDFGGPGNWFRASEQLRELLRDEEEMLERAMYNGLPADIAAKRSWSNVVKYGKARDRLRRLRAARRAVSEEHTALPIMRKLGIAI